MNPPTLIGAVGRLVDTTSVVLIASHGDTFHEPHGGYLREPACGVLATPRHRGPIGVTDRAAFGWVAVDRQLAELLDRTPCGRCWPEGPPPRQWVRDQPALFHVDA